MFKKWFAFPVVRIGATLIVILALVLAFPDTAHWLTRSSTCSASSR